MKYEDYADIIKKVCHRYAYSKTEFDDFLSFSNELFLTIQKKYNPDKGTFKNFLLTCLHNALISKRVYANKQRNRHTPFDDYHHLVNINPEQLYLFKEAFTSLTDDAQFVIRLVIESPEEIISASKNFEPLYYLRTIKEILKSKQWAMRRIARTIKEIKEAVHENKINQ